MRFSRDTDWRFLAPSLSGPAALLNETCHPRWRTAQCTTMSTCPRTGRGTWSGQPMVFLDAIVVALPKFTSLKQKTLDWARRDDFLLPTLAQNPQKLKERRILNIRTGTFGVVDCPSPLSEPLTRSSKADSQGRLLGLLPPFSCALVSLTTPFYRAALTMQRIL